MASSSNDSQSFSESENHFPTPISANKLSPYVVGDKVVVAPPDLDTGKIKIGSLVYANLHPPSWAKGYDEIVNFMWYHPFGKVMIEKPDWVFQDLLCEFWASCVVKQNKKGDAAIYGSVLNGKKKVYISYERLKSAFELSYMPDNEYEPVVSHTEAKNVLQEVGYTGPLASVVKMKYLTGIWNYLLSTISKTLQVKAGSFDQPNVLELQIFHAMVTMTKIDFAALIFKDLVDRVNKKSLTIPYGRILALIIEAILDNDYSLATGQTVECKSINSNIFNSPKVSVQGLTRAMQIYLDFCRRREEEQEALREAVPSSTRSGSDTQSANQGDQGTQASEPSNSSNSMHSSPSKEGEGLATSSATLAAPSFQFKSASNQPSVEDLVPRIVKKKRSTRKSVSASVGKILTPKPLEVPPGSVEAEERSEAVPDTQADIPNTPRPSTLSQKGVDEIKGTIASTQPSKQGEGIETKTSSQGHTESMPNSPSSASQKVDDIIKGITLDLAQIQESESVHVQSEDGQTKESSIERQGDTAALPKADQTPLIHSESALAANASSMSQEEVQATILPRDTLVQQHTIVEGQSSTLNITSAESVSASVLGQRDSVGYLAVFKAVMSAPCAAKGTIDGPHDVNENIVTISGSDSSFDDEFAHPSSRDDLMEVASGGVDQHHDQPIPISHQPELNVNLSQADRLIINSERSTHETHSHEQMFQDSLHLHPLLYSPIDQIKDCRLLFPESVAFKPTASSSQAATFSFSDVVGQLTEVISTYKVENSKLTECLEKIQKDQVLTDKKVDKMYKEQTAIKEIVVKAVDLMQKNQEKLTESLESLTKKINEEMEKNKGTLGQIENAATRFTRKVTVELQAANKSQADFKKDLIEASTSFKNKVALLHEDFAELRRACCLTNVKIDVLNNRIPVFATPMSSFPGDDDKKGEKDHTKGEKGSTSKKKRSEMSEEEIQRQKAEVDRDIEAYFEKVRQRNNQADRRMIVYGSNVGDKEEETKRPESESGGEKNVNEGVEKESDKVEGETIVGVEKFGGIRKEVVVEKDIRKEGGVEKLKRKMKSVQADPVQAVPEQAVQTDTAPKENLESSSSDDTVTLSQFQLKKRKTEAGSSGLKVLTQEEKDWELAAQNAPGLKMSLKQAYKLVVEDRLERERVAATKSDSEIAKAVQEQLNKEDEEDLAAIGTKRKVVSKEKRKMVVHSKPSQKVRDVGQSVKAHSWFDALEKRQVTENVQYRRHPEPIHQVILKRRRGKSIPSIRLTRKGFEANWETYDLDKLLDLGYTEWVELHDHITGMPGIHKEVVLEAIEKKLAAIVKYKIDITGLPRPRAYDLDDEDESEEPLKKKRKRNVNLQGTEGDHTDFLRNLNPSEFLGLLSTEAIDKLLSHLNLTLPAGVENARSGLHITEPEHGMYFVDTKGKLVFQRTAELNEVPTLHLFTLYRFCVTFSEQGNGYEQFLIDEGLDRKIDVTIAPSFEVKQETVELIGE